MLHSSQRLAMTNEIDWNFNLRTFHQLLHKLPFFIWSLSQIGIEKMQSIFFQKIKISSVAVTIPSRSFGSSGPPAMRQNNHPCTPPKEGDLNPFASLPLCVKIISLCFFLVSEIASSRPEDSGVRDLQ